MLTLAKHGVTLEKCHNGSVSTEHSLILQSALILNPRSAKFFHPCAGSLHNIRRCLHTTFANGCHTGSPHACTVRFNVHHQPTNVTGLTRKRAGLKCEYLAYRITCPLFLVPSRPAQSEDEVPIEVANLAGLVSDLRDPQLPSKVGGHVAGNIPPRRDGPHRGICG